MSVSLHLSPRPAFCIKSSVVQPALYAPRNNALEPPLHLPAGLKVFVNIAWDPNVPPPPPGSERAIQRAMDGEDIDPTNPDAWYVPVIVSDARRDKDKAGKPALVFDCIYNASIKLRSLADPKFKLFLIELALQRIEVQSSLVLSREISTPNIASKGTLAPRTVSVPSFLLHEVAPPAAPPQPAIQELVSSHPTPSSAPSHSKPKGILKTPANQLPATVRDPSKLTWKWSKEGSSIHILVDVPLLNRSQIVQATLDIEPRRFILSVPGYPLLDVNLALSDAEIVASASPGQTISSGTLFIEHSREPDSILTLKRQRAFDVDGATSEWRVDHRVLLIIA